MEGSFIGTMGELKETSTGKYKMRSTHTRYFLKNST
jgi:hypothetical protein